MVLPQTFGVESLTYEAKVCEGDKASFFEQGKRSRTTSVRFPVPRHDDCSASFHMSGVLHYPAAARFCKAPDQANASSQDSRSTRPIGMGRLSKSLSTLYIMFTHAA
jgi:hypothetical protein